MVVAHLKQKPIDGLNVSCSPKFNYTVVIVTFIIRLLLLLSLLLDDDVYYYYYYYYSCLLPGEFRDHVL